MHTNIHTFGSKNLLIKNPNKMLEVVLDAWITIDLFHPLEVEFNMFDFYRNHWLFLSQPILEPEVKNFNVS